MSYSTVLGVVPDSRPVKLAEFHNSHGWAPSIWRRLLGPEWIHDGAGLNRLWRSIETLPEWQQAAVVFTFDTGVVPFQAFTWAADQLAEFERRLPSPEGHANHLPAMIDLLRGSPEVPLIGVWGTSVSENPFDPWDWDADEPGNGIPLSAMYVLERHREFLRAGSTENQETE